MFSLLITLLLLLIPLTQQQTVVSIRGGESGMASPELVSALEIELAKFDIGLEMTGDAPIMIEYNYGNYGGPNSTRIILYDGITMDLQQSPLLIERLYEWFEDNGDYEQQARYVTGVILYSLGRCDDAMPYIEEFADSQETGFFLSNHSVDFMRGVCAVQDEEYELAIQYFEPLAYSGDGQSLASPTDSAINLAWLYLQQHRNDEAFAIVDDYVYRYVGPLHIPLAKPNANGIHALILRARFHAEAGNFEGALFDLNIAENISADTTFAAARVPDIYYFRGLVYRDGYNDPENAKADFGHYLQAAPDGKYAAEVTQFLEEIE